MPKKNTAISMPRMADVSKAASADIKDAEKSLTLIKRATVRTEKELRVVTMWCAEIKDRRAIIDAKCKQFTDPLKAVIRDIEVFFGPALESLNEAERLVKRLIADYASDLAERRDLLLGKVINLKDRRAKEKAIAEAGTCEMPKLPGLSLRQSWDGEVIDAAKIPREYLIPDLKALKAATRAAGGDPRISGWRARASTTVAVTVDKVAR